MKEIKLTNGGVALVDDEDFEKLSSYKWHRHDERTLQYVRVALYGSGKQQILLMHRVVMNAPTGVDVDHRDGDGLNNQKYNLRLCTDQQNSMNLKLFRTSTSGHKGVSWNKQFKKWEAYIWFHRKKIRLGEYKEKSDAIAARENAEKELYGNWSRRINVNTQDAPTTI